MKKYNIILILLTIVHGYNIAQPLQYNGSNVDTIIVKSTYYVPHVQKGLAQKEDIYTLYYDSDADDFIVKSRIKTERYNGKEVDTMIMKSTYFTPKEAPFHKEDIYTFRFDFEVKDYIIKNYIKTKQWNEKEQIIIDSLHNAKEKIQNILSAIEQTYKLVNLSDFDINENNIDSLIDSAFLLWDEEYRSHKCYKDIQKCKNIDEFKRFLTEQYSENQVKISSISTGSGKMFSICIKTSLNTYYIYGDIIYKSNQPWRISDYNPFETIKSDSNFRYNVINFDINNSLLEILPNNFYNIVDLTILGMIQDYIEWGCTGGRGAGPLCGKEARIK